MDFGAQSSQSPPFVSSAFVVHHGPPYDDGSIPSLFVSPPHYERADLSSSSSLITTSISPPDRLSALLRPQPLRATSWPVSQSAANSLSSTSSTMFEPSWSATGFSGAFDYDHPYSTQAYHYDAPSYTAPPPPPSIDADFTPRYSFAPHPPASLPLAPASQPALSEPEFSHRRADAASHDSQMTTVNPPKPRSAPPAQGRVETFSIWEGVEKPPNAVRVREQAARKGQNEGVSDLHLRKFACKLCGKRFKRAGTFNQHKKTHTGERPHGCTIPGCGKRFSTSSNLKRHIGTHER